MSRVWLAGLLLLVPAHAVAADHHHVASAHACVDPRAALASPVRPHGAVHQEESCFRVRSPLHLGSSTLARTRLARRHGRRLHHPIPPPREPPREQAVSDARLLGNVAPGQRAPMPAPVPQPVPAAPAPAPLQAAARVAGAAPRQDRLPSPVPVAPPALQPGRFVHRFSPLLLWIVIISLAMLLVRLVRRRHPRPPAPGRLRRLEPTAASAGWDRFRPVRQLAGTQPATPAAIGYPHDVSPPAGAQAAADGESGVSVGEYKSRCVARLRRAGWDARTRFSANMPGPHVIASQDGLVLALQCHLSAEPVDVEAVEDACLVRERQCSDLAAVVSNAPFTEPARQLAARTGIVLLHEDQLASLAM